MQPVERILIMILANLLSSTWPCIGDHRAGRATTDRLKVPACPRRDFQTRFATTRMLYLPRV